MRKRVSRRIGKGAADPRAADRWQFLRRLLWVAALTLLTLKSAYGFDDKRTHPSITLMAVDASALDAVLRNELGTPDGIKARLSDSASGRRQQVFRWLQEGSTREDSDAFCRASNHFHNPLKPYPSAGMTDVGG